MLPLLILLAALPQNQAVTPPATPSPTHECPGNTPTTGVYRNYSYGFTVTLPPGVRAFWNSPSCVYDPKLQDCVCMSDHGRDIPLGPEAYMVIFAAYTSAEETPLPTLLVTDIETFQRGIAHPDFKVLEVEPFRLAHLPAFRYVATTERQGSARYREAVVAHTRDGHIQYTIAIEAPQAMYEANRKAFRSMLSTWRVTPRE